MNPKAVVFSLVLALMPGRLAAQTLPGAPPRHRPVTLAPQRARWKERRA